jgi:hypothetical protein
MFFALLTAVTLVSPVMMYAQTAPTAADEAADSKAEDAGKDAATEPAPPPSSFRGVSLGMSLADLKTALKSDALFGYRGDPDVSFEPSREAGYVETTGSSFIRRGLFQTKSDKLYAISLTLNTTLVDYYSVYSALVKKYGEPTRLSPRQAVWEDASTRLSLERPLVVKYLDKAAFAQILTESSAKKSETIHAREDFLGDF